MATARKSHSSASIRKVLRLLAWCVLLAGTAHGQPQQPQPGTLADAINEVRRGNFAYVQQIVRIAGAEQAIPVLQDLFAHGADADTKGWIASELVKLGDKDDIYWDLLMKQAREVVESDAPDFLNFDAQGKASDGPSPEFVAWAKAHNFALESVAYEAVYPIKLGLLARTEDSRAIPLLRRGLLAPNHMVEAVAADGLAILKDKDSIPLIVEACKRAPAEAASAIAMSLLQFHDPEAQRAAEPYLSGQLVDALHQGKQ